MKSRTVVVGLIALYALISSPILDAQLKVDLELTQGIQYFEHPTEKSNTIELVAGRRMAVRAKLSGLPHGRTVSKVEAKLYTGAGQWEPPTNPTEFVTFLNSGAVWDRGQTNNTLNFRIEELATGSYTFTAKIDMAFTDGVSMKVEGSETKNTVDVRPLEIRFVPIEFESKSGTVILAPKPLEVETELVELIEGCFPIQVPNTVFHWEAALFLDKTKDRGCASIIDDRKGTSDVEVTLKALKNYGPAFPPNTDVLVYGLVAPKPRSATIGDRYCVPTLGWSSCDEMAAFGTAELPWAPKTLAHELGHLHKLQHCGGCEDAKESCDMDGQVPFDVHTMTAMPYRTQSFMTCGTVPYTEVWATPKNYKDVLTLLKAGGRNDCTGPRNKDSEVHTIRLSEAP